jgi:hypothetical protein
MSGPSSPPPTPYQPANQAGADASFQGGVGQLFSGGQGLQQSVVPAYGQVTQSVSNNPYYQTAQNYAGLTSGLAGNTVAPSQFGAGAASMGTGDSLTQQAGAIGNSGYLQQAQQALAQGFDPRQELYNRSYQQMLDQQNAINAMNGVAGTPYGAGLASQGAQNFNMDWQNQQLAREAQAASTYGNILGSATGAEGGLASGAGSAYNTGSGLEQAGLQTLRTAGQEQNQTFLQQQQAILDALNAQTTGTNAAYGLTQQGIGDQGTYLNIGQNATSGAQNAWQMQNQANQSAMSGIFGALGTAASFIPW